MATLTIPLEEALQRKLEQAAEERGISVVALVQAVLSSATIEPAREAEAGSTGENFDWRTAPPVRQFRSAGAGASGTSDTARRTATEYRAEPWR